MTMKRKLQLAIPWLMALLLLLSFRGYGQLAVEEFNYPIGSLLTDNGWTAHSGAGTESPTVTSGLSFAGYLSSGIGGAALLDNNGEDVHKNFPEQTTGTVYVAFVIQTEATNSAGYFFHLGQTTIGTTFFTRVWVNATGDGLGIGSSAPAEYSPITAGVPTLVVVKLNLDTKLSELFVFATFPAAEPATPTASFTETATFTNVGSIALRQYNAAQRIIVDGIRIATNWADAVTSDTAPPTVALPTINPAGGNFYGPVEVSISTLTEGASIYYTTDGTDPDGTSTLYTAPFTVSATTTVKAIGIKEGLDNSSIASATLTFPPITDVATIASLRAGLTDGTAYRLTGQALITAMDAFNNRKFIQDASGAIMIFDNQGIIDTEYSIGDRIQNVTGTLSLANNMLRFVPVLDPGAAVSSGNPVTPTVFTIGALATGDQAKLVKLNNVTFTSTGTFANGQNYTISDGVNTLVLRTDFWNVDYIGTPIPTSAHNITGVIIQYNDALQIVPRNLADFYEIPYTTHFQFAAASGTLPAWFGTDTERGMAAGGGHLYAVSRNAGTFVRVFDPLTGLETGTLNTTGVAGGTFVLNDAEVSGDGVVLAANMAMNTSAAGTAVFKVYRLEATAAPVPVIEYALPGIARLGDKFTLVGNFDDGSATLYAADGSNPRIFKFTLTGGVFGAPEIIPIAVPHGSTPAISPLPDGSFYYNANGQSLSKLNADGTLIGAVPGGIIATGSNAIKYLGTDGDDEIVAVFNYGVGQERIKVIRVPSGDPTLATLEFETPSMRANANANGSGDVAFIPGTDGSVNLYILSTNNGFAGYESLFLDLVFPDYTAGEPSYDITTFPYHQNFNNELFPPDGYQNLAVVGTGTWTRVTTGTNPTTNPQDGAGMIRYNAYSQSSGNSAALITPKVVIPAGDYQVRFSMYRDAGYATTADRVEVLVNDTPDLVDAVSLGVVNRSTTLAPVVPSAGWYYFAFPFPAEKSGEYYVIFKAISGYGNNIFIDAFYLEEVPTQPLLSVVPSSLNFGLVLQGTASAPKSLALSNVAVGTLTINDGDLTITGPDAAVFSLGTITYPIEIDPGETVNISLGFTPAAVGNYNATLNIAHNGSNSPTAVALAGSGYAPFAAFVENFDTAPVGGLPSAWKNIIQSTSTSAGVDVTTAGTPFSAPNQIRMANSADANATLLLITPAVTNVTSNRIGFMAKGTGYVLQVGTITNPTDPATFTLVESITLTSAHTQYYVNFDEYTGTDQYIAFKHGLGGTYRTIYIDDVVWEALPADPVFAITPTSKNFGMLQIGQTTTPQTFTISNTGAGTLTINPSDITLTGTDAAEFVLTNLTETVNLAFGESATITAAFAPQTVGIKSATIEINDNLTGKVIHQIPLTGEGFDATLYPVFVVDFNGETFPPLGWTRFTGILDESTDLVTTTSGWAHHVFGNLGGTNNSAYINIYSTKNHWLITPPINLGDGTTDYQLSFDIALTPWTGTAQSTLGPDDYVAVVISTDNGVTWTDANVLIDWDDSDVISPTGNHIVVSLEGYSGLVKVGFYAERPSGSTPDLRFYVDNVSVEEAAEVPVFTASPASKDFGNVGVSEQSQPQTFVISNSGPGTLLVNAPVLDNTTDYILSFSEEDFPASLTGTETVTFNVTFAPQTEGVHTGVISITHGEGGAETATIALTGNGVVRPAGSTCANPYIIASLPLVNYQDNTEDYGNDYQGTWLNPTSNYLNGYDFVAEFTLDEPGYLSGSVVGSWTGLIIVDECPSPESPATVLAVGSGSNGGSFNNVWIGPGTYYAIVSTWPTPNFTDFTLNLSFMTGYTVTFVVEDEEQTPITDAVVTLGTITNEAGDYVFDNVIPGTFAYTVVKEGYYDGTGSVVVTDADVTETVTLVMIPVNPVIVSIAPVDDVEVEFGTVLDDAIAALAPTTTITDSDEGTHTVTLTWTIADYDGNVAGDYNATGTFTLPEGVDQADPAIPLEVSAVVTVLEEPIETFAVTFNVNMTYAEGFDPEADVVYITGDLLGWASPGSDPDNQTMARVGETMVWTKTLELEAGTYAYKYFLNAGWDGGEWQGGADRNLVVEADMEVNDWFGYLTDPTSVTDPSLAQIRVFPVPARTTVYITSPEVIRDLRIIDMLGQVAYSTRVAGLSHEVNVSGFNSGIYFIQILTDKGMETRRIQVQK